MGSGLFISNLNFHRRSLVLRVSGFHIALVGMFKIEHQSGTLDLSRNSFAAYHAAGDFLVAGLPGARVFRIPVHDAMVAAHPIFTFPRRDSFLAAGRYGAVMWRRPSRPDFADAHTRPPFGEIVWVR